MWPDPWTVLISSPDLSGSGTKSLVDGINFLICDGTFVHLRAVLQQFFPGFGYLHQTDRNVQFKRDSDARTSWLTMDG